VLAFRLSCLALTAATAVLAAELPPAETLSRLESAGKVLETWPGTFRLTTRAVVSKPDGDDREESVTVMRMGAGTDGPEVQEIVSATRDGKDVTAEVRGEVEKERDEARKAAAKKKQKAEEDEDDGGGFELTLPGGKQTGKFAFTALPAADGACGAAFAPGAAHAKDAGLTTGELRWDCATLDPLWVVARPAKNPKGVKEMSLRMEIARSGDLMYVARTVTDGVGGVLFIKRKFHVETEIAELAPAGPGAGTP
jgi:hypothetical protein